MTFSWHTAETAASASTIANPWSAASNAPSAASDSISPAVAPPTLANGASDSQILTVGNGEEFATLSAAVAAAQNGDTIMVKAGTYVNDFADVTTNITIESFGGQAKFVATEAPSNLKGILTVDNSCTIEGLSFSGAAISAADGGNAAGIRYEGGNMVLQNDVFENNQNGVMGTPVIGGLSENTVTINDCLFKDNGAGDGYTHNCYIGTVTSLIFTNNISEGAIVGHDLKSRAYSNTIENNTFRDGATGTASYEIDLPNGGTDIVENNTIEKGPDASNEALVHFGGEGIPYAGSSLLVEGNRFVNNYGAGAVAVMNQTANSVTITGNTFCGFGHATLASGPAVETNNVNGNGVALPNSTLTGLLPGNTVIFTDDNPHTITLSGSIVAVEGGGGLLTATASSGHVIVVGGAGGLDFNEIDGSGGNTITTAAGSANTLTLIGQDVVGSSGTDTINCGPCDVTGQISGVATIFDGTGNNSWGISGTATITGQGGNPMVSVAQTGNASIVGTVSYVYVENNGGDFALSVGEDGNTVSMSDIGGAATAYVAGGSLTVATSSGPTGATLTLGAGMATVTSAGADTIYAGSGNDSVIVSGAANVYAGTGALSVYGRSDQGGATVHGNGGTVFFGGDTGNITYLGGTLASTVQDQLNNMVLIGGAGQMTVLGGSDNTLEGGCGGLVYTATDGGGANHITTASGASDTLTLSGGDIVQSNGNDVINEGSGNQTLVVTGASTINGGTGNNFVTLSGNDTLNGVGQDFVTVTQNATAQIVAGTNTVITETGALVHFQTKSGTPSTAAVHGGEVTLQGGTSTGGTIQITTAAGYAAQVALGAGAANVQSNGTDTISAAGGNNIVNLNGGSSSLCCGSGSMTAYSASGSAAVVDTVTGGSGALTYSQNGATLHFIGGTGSAVINGGFGALFITGGAGTVAAQSTGGAMDFTGGTGAANLLLSGGGGSIEFGAGSTTVQEAGYGNGVIYDFVAGHGGGYDVISGFNPNADSFNFNGVSVAQETLAGGNTALTLSDSTQVLLVGFSDTHHMF